MTFSLGSLDRIDLFVFTFDSRYSPSSTPLHFFFEKLVLSIPLPIRKHPEIPVYGGVTEACTTQEQLLLLPGIQ